MITEIQIDDRVKVIGEEDPEEYAKSVKNGLVLTYPQIHPPDVRVVVKEDDGNIIADTNSD